VVAYPHSHPRSRAMTFLEIMVVVVIIGVMSVVTAVVWEGTYGKTQMTSDARSFMSLARYARQQAITRKHTVELRVNFETDRYQLQLDPDKKKSYIVSGDQEPREIEQVRQFGSKRMPISIVTMQGPTVPTGGEKIVPIRFFRNGSATPTTMVLSDKEKKTMTIEILEATGAVRTYAGPPKEVIVEVPDGEEDGI
jgi:prepilin-type N-terminal cleavage/methylation domain-containing protein